MGICYMAQETQTGLCVNLKAWDGDGDGSEFQKGGDICIPMANSEKAMASHSSTLAWKIPWTEGPDGLQSMGSLGV